MQCTVGVPYHSSIATANATSAAAEAWMPGTDAPLLLGKGGGAGADGLPAVALGEAVGGDLLVGGCQASPTLLLAGCGAAAGESPLLLFVPRGQVWPDPYTTPASAPKPGSGAATLVQPEGACTV